MTPQIGFIARISHLRSFRMIMEVRKRVVCLRFTLQNAARLRLFLNDFERAVPEVKTLLQVRVSRAAK